mmetsp:Transcript_19427/g.18539  ORF Transcript_19427/g.18539 Transcript_19427/m.18539 type:complete len:88 (+) Transcript_19427:16-279(+)
MSDDKVYTLGEFQEKFPEEVLYIPLDPQDPIYHQVYEHTLPPPEAYRYVPPDSKHVTTVTKKGPGQRKFFEGWNNLTRLEETKMKEL